jgi:hypothetical protein
MAGENLVKVLQIAGAALGIPAAAAGTSAAYQNYFSTDVTCQKLRSNIVATMERSVAPETKRSLLRKEVNEFDKLCGEGDPDARTIFHAALTPEHPAPAAAETANATTVDAVHGPAPAGAQPDSSRRSQLQSAAVFGAPGTKEHYGWVALSRRQSGAWVAHFNGYIISDTSLPPPGTVLSAQIMLPVWSEPQGTTNDQSKLQSRLPNGACVRVLSTRGGSGRLWAEVAPASCS